METIDLEGVLGNMKEATAAQEAVTASVQAAIEPVSMMYQVAKIMHFVGIILIFIGFGILIARALSGSNEASLKKIGSIVSGVGLVILLLFSLHMYFSVIAKDELSDHNWFFAKIGIWVLLGGMTTAINKKQELAVPLMIVLVLLGAAAAWLGVMKPF